MQAARALAEASGCRQGRRAAPRQEAAGRVGARRRLGRRAAALRLLTALWGIDPAHARARSRRGWAATCRPACSACRCAGRGRGPARRRSTSPTCRDAGAAGQSARAAVDRRGVRALGRRRPRAARRLARGPQRSRGAGASRWSRRSPTCSTGSRAADGREFVAHVGLGRDLLRLVRQRGGARPAPPSGARATGGTWRPACARGARDDGRPILTAAAMRAAEQAAIDGGTPVETLMERAGAALAEAVYRFAGPTAGADPVRAGQ